MSETSAPLVTDLSQVLLWFDHSTTSLVGLGMQLAWITGFVLLIQLVWGRGVRRFAAVGG